MKLLLDTHLLLWPAGGSDQMPAEAVRLLSDPANELFFSPVSLWEVVIKNGLGRADFQVDPHHLRRGLMDNGYRELSIKGGHAVAIASLPAIHKDPFDRILVAQATNEGMILVTSDAIVAQHLGPIQRV